MKRSPPTKTLIAETLAIMDILDHVDEVGNCLLWNFTTSSNGYPILKVRGCGCVLVRRQIFLLSGGELGYRQPVLMKCDEQRCVKPGHMVASNASEVAKRAVKNGAWKSVTRSAKISQAKRKTAKLNAEQADEIRHSTEAGYILAARYGVNKSQINRIRRGEAWRDYYNPYAGLLASNASWNKPA